MPQQPRPPVCAASSRFTAPDTFDRSGTGSLKWATAGTEAKPERIPLGVADMDLPGLPELFEALRERALHPVIGYTRPGPRSRDLVVAWYRDRFGAAIDPDWIVQVPFGPRTAIRFVLDAVLDGGPRGAPDRAPDGGSRPSRPVLTTTPEYAWFGQAARAAGLPLTEIPLHRTAGTGTVAVAADLTAGRRAAGGDVGGVGGGEGGWAAGGVAGKGYRLPVEAFEAAAQRAGTTAIVLSNPHNPTGRIWSPCDVRRLAAAAAAGGGVLVSDEVHGDLVHPGGTHTVAVHAAGAELARSTVTVHSIGKTFNVSGLADALLLVPCPGLRARIVRAIEGHGFFEGSRPLAALAQDIAFARGGPWRDGLVGYLAGNRDLAVRGLRHAAPGLVASVPQASYLLWLDGTALRRQGPPADRETLLRDCGLDMQDGGAFGEAGRGFLRFNYGLPRPRLAEAVERLARYATVPAECRGGEVVPGSGGNEGE